MGDLSFLPPEVDRYLLQFLEDRHPLLKEMESLAQGIRMDVGRGQTIPFPIVGPLVGRLLAHYARILGARRVFELGSGYGYSAFWFALGMGSRGRLVCTDGREDNRRTALDFFKRAKMAPRLDFRVGDGLEILKRERGGFDIIFMDMEKSRYPLGFAAALPRLRRGGLLIADNVLWSGEVLKPSQDPATRGLVEFTRLITSSKHLQTVIHPIRDGVSVSLKTK